MWFGKKSRQTQSHCISQERGASAIEYAVILSFLTLLVPVTGHLGDSLADNYANASAKIMSGSNATGEMRDDGNLWTTWTVSVGFHSIGGTESGVDSENP